MYSSPVHMGQYGGQKEYRQLARGIVTFEGEVKLKQLIQTVHFGHLIYIVNIKKFRIFFNMITWSSHRYVGSSRCRGPSIASVVTLIDTIHS